MNSITRRIGIATATVCVSLVIALTAVEVLLRIFQLAPSIGVVTVTESQFLQVPGIFAPKQDLIDQRLPTLPHRVTTNSLGYRGKAFDRAKSRGEIRVLMIGDSFTYGDFVDDEETLPVQLQRELQGNCKGVQVINAGVGGTTIVTHAEMARRALPLELDLVVLTFSENDVSDLRDPMWYRLTRNRQIKSRFPLSLFYSTIRYTALWNFALILRARLISQQNRRAVVTRRLGTVGEDLQSRLRKQYAAALAALRDGLANEDTTLVFVIYPSYNSIQHSGLPEHLQWVTRTAAESHIATINLLGPLRDSELPINNLYLLPHDGHPSPRGYAVSARHLAAQLRQGELLEAFCNTP